MLKHLYIKHFTIIAAVEVEFDPGLTVLTGETGAGKSILIDALQVVLGERAESGMIKNGSDRCEISAIFAVADNQPAQAWLEQQAMDEGSECLLRRVITQDGRSRSTINGRPCPLQLVRELGALLVHIHGQNQHQQLLKTDYQRELLDQYAQNQRLAQAVRQIYQDWREANQELTLLSTKDPSHQKELLDFQLQEFAELGLQAGELAELEQEHRRLTHAEEWLLSGQQVAEILSEGEEGSVLNGLHAADAVLKSLPPEYQSAAELLQQAMIQTEEAVSLVRHALQVLELNPERLQWVDQRMTRIHDLARKHRVLPEELLPLQLSLESQRQQLEHSGERVALLTQKLAAMAQEYPAQAQRLTLARQKAAKKLSAEVTAQIQTLGMPNGRFDIQLIPREDGVLHVHGAERIEYLLSTNPGQPFAPLSKVASGGELSRVGLAIQVAAASVAVLPTLIFDEVDVGIGGGTAEIVGKQLKNLGKKAQVLCVTHLPQVAAQGHQHLFVEKQARGEGVHTSIRLLTAEERIKEVARMLGGVKITEKTLDHAREMVG